jgi:hypothetical protein
MDPDTYVKDSFNESGYSNLLIIGNLVVAVQYELGWRQNVLKTLKTFMLLS